MIPIRDGIPTRRVPVVNYLLIAVNILVFILQALAGTAQENIMLQYSLIPANFREGITLPNLLDIFTSMFMHAGIAHIAGNMLYLWIFGDNVEDAMGSIKYLIFYLIGGVAASAVHVFTNPGSQIPTVGHCGSQRSDRRGAWRLPDPLPAKQGANIHPHRLLHAHGGYPGHRRARLLVPDAGLHRRHELGRT